MAKRAGITASEKGDEASLGWWPERFGSVSTGWIGTAKNARGNALIIAQRLHSQNRAVIQARTTKQIATIPEPDVRAKLARADLKKLDAAENQLNEIERGTFEKRISLQPFDYGATRLHWRNEPARVAFRLTVDDRRTAKRSAKKGDV